MASGFSTTSEDDIFSVIVNKNKKTEEGIIPAEILDRVKAQQQARLEAAARVAQKYDPESYAQAAKLAPGIDPQLAVRNLKTVMDMDKLNKYQEVFQKSPKLAAYFSNNPADLPHANPDELDKVAGLSWLFQAPIEAVKEGLRQDLVNSDAADIIKGIATPEQVARVRAAENIRGRTFGADGFFQEALVNTAQMLPYMGDVALHSMEGGAKGAIAGGIAGGAVGSFTGPGAIATGATGFMGGLGVGSTTSGLMRNIELSAGSAYVEFQSFRDENNQPLDESTLRWAALFSGIGVGSLDQLGLSKTLGKIPGVGPIFGAFGKNGMKAILKNPTTRQAFINFAKNMGEGATVETLTEMGQEAFQIFAGEMAKASSEGEFPAASPEDMAGRVIEAGKQAIQAQMLLGPLASGTRFAGDLMIVKKSQQENKAVREVLGQIYENPMMDRSPEIVGKMIDGVAPDRNLYIPADELKTLFQSEGQDVYGPALPNWRARFDEALKTGGDVKISMGEFVAAFGKQPTDSPLLDLVRTNPNNYTSRDIAEVVAATDAQLNSELGRAQDKSAVPVDYSIIDQFKKMALEAGYTEQAATSYGTLFGSYIQTTARKLGITPEQFIQENPVDIMRVDLGLEHNVDGVNSMPDALELFQSTIDDTDQNLNVSIDQETSTEFVFDNNTDNEILSEPNVYENLANTQIEDSIDIIQPSYSQDKKGSITFKPDNSATIRLFNQADMSTLLHEAGHYFLETSSRLAAQSPAIAEEYNVLKKHLGISEDGKITREQHEKFAVMAEAYFMEGKAPTPALRKAFESFRIWLKAIYRSLKNLGGKVHPEIAAVFDSMLGAEKTFTNIANDVAYQEMFKDAASMGVSPEDYLAYQNLVQEARTVAQDATIGRIVGQQKRLAAAWFKKVEKEYQVLAEEELRKVAPYNHIETFNKGELKLDLPTMAAKYDKKTLAKFPRKAFSAKGMDPDLVAEVLGYPTLDEMVYDFRQAPTLKEAAIARAKKNMIDVYGQDFTQEAIVELASKRALAEEARVVILSKELVALKKHEGMEIGEVMPRQAAQQIARETVYVKKIKDLDEFRIQAAVRRNASGAERAMVQGDWAKAADYKRKQLIAQAIDNQNQIVNRRIEQIREKAVRYTRSASTSVDPATMEQIRALVTKFGFGKISKKKLNKILNLREYLLEAEQQGFVTKVPPYLIKQASITSYKELTVEELLGFGDALDNLEHIGRLKNKIKTKQKLIAFELVKTELLDRYAQGKTKPKKMANYAQEEKGWSNRLAEFTASWMKPEQIVEWLDMGDVDGPTMNYVFQPIADAQFLQQDLSLKYNKKLMEIFDKIEPDYLMEKISIKSLGTTLSREQLYAIALNTGNESNRKKLLEGEVWNETILADVLGHMTKQDWDRVQKVWDLLDTLWPRVADLEKKLTGVAPPRVEGKEFMTPYGNYKGGYYPVVYDFKTDRGLNAIQDPTPIDRKLDSDSLFNPAFVKPGTNHTHTYKRTGVAKPLKLELSVLPGHMHNVIHDLAYREAVRGAFKLLWDADIKQAIIKREGEAVYTQLQHWLKAVATEHSFETDPNVQFIQRLRTGATIFGMGYRVSTAIAQPLGIFPAMTRVGFKQMMNSLAHVSRHPLQNIQMVNEISGEMRGRFNSQDRDIKDTVKKLSLTSSRMDKIRSYAFYFIGAADKYISTVTWLGAYQQALEKGFDRELAIREADRTVRLTQGTGNVKDMAKITNDGEVLKLFTMFYSYFSAQWNMQVDLTRKTKADIAAGDLDTLFRERLPQWACLVVFPAVFGALLTGQGPDDDESWIGWGAKKIALYPLAAMPFVRDVVGSVGYGYQLSPAAKAGKATGEALAQVANLDFLDAVKPTAIALSVLFKIPSGQAITTTEALFKGLMKDDLTAADLIFGRRGRQ